MGASAAFSRVKFKAMFYAFMQIYYFTGSASSGNVDV